MLMNMFGSTSCLSASVDEPIKTNNLFSKRKAKLRETSVEMRQTSECIANDSVDGDEPEMPLGNVGKQPNAWVLAQTNPPKLRLNFDGTNDVVRGDTHSSRMESESLEGLGLRVWVTQGEQVVE